MVERRQQITQGGADGWCVEHTSVPEVWKRGTLEEGSMLCSLAELLGHHGALIAAILDEEHDSVTIVLPKRFSELGLGRNRHSGHPHRERPH